MGMRRAGLHTPWHCNDIVFVCVVCQVHNVVLEEDGSFDPLRFDLAAAKATVESMAS